MQDKGGERDLRFMRLALDQAEQALQKQEIPVGCVFIGSQEIDSEADNIKEEEGHTRGDFVIARGGNKTNEMRNGSSHAEMNAIQSAIESGLDPQAFFGSELFHVFCQFS